MTIRLTWLGHGSWLIETAKNRIVLDPFLTDNPVAKRKPEDLGPVSHILVSHAHFDHIADVATVAATGEPTLVANFEIAQWFQKNHGVQNTIGMNTGGTLTLPWGKLTMTPALHSSSFPDGSYGGCPGGFLLDIADKRIYFACDTAFFSDMAHYAHRVDLAILPIGDLFTMGIDESIRAIRLIQPKNVAPAHYDTWPPIGQDASEWAARVRSETDAEPVVPRVDEPFEV